MTDTDAIRQTIANVEKHQNNTDEFIALHTADALIVNIAGRRVLGRDAIREAMERALATPLAKVLTKTEIVDIRFTTPDVALVSCVKHVSDEREDGGELPAKGSLTYVVTREGDDWKIASAQTTPVLT
ncbi:YybH family protein [Amycolatopsis lurida]